MLGGKLAPLRLGHITGPVRGSPRRARALPDEGRAATGPHPRGVWWGASASVRPTLLSEGVSGGLDQGAWVGRSSPAHGCPSLPAPSPPQREAVETVPREAVGSGEGGPGKLLGERKAPGARAPRAKARSESEPVLGVAGKSCGNGHGRMRTASGPRTQS